MSESSNVLSRILRSVLGGAARGAKQSLRDQARRSDRSAERPGSHPGGRPAERPSGKPAGAPRPQAHELAASGSRQYPGDFTGVPPMQYEARRDDRPDPGEVVWAWVPFEEDCSQGKDRPVLLVGRDGKWLLGLPLTSKDHDRDAEQERRAGRLWTDIGTGEWDRSGRPSEVRLNRVIRVDPAAVRREGGRLDEATFNRVADEVRAAQG